MTKPLTLQYELPGCTAVFAGRQSRTAHSDAYAALSALGAQPTKICQVLVPSDDTQLGYQAIAATRSDSPVHAEGVILTDVATGAFMRTRDCPTVILAHEKNGRVIMTHAGKYALRPPLTCGGCTANIISKAIREIAPAGDTSYTHAVVFGGICPTCFRHDDKFGQAFMAPFLERFGATVFQGDPLLGQLDLNKLIKLQLVGYGVPECNLVVDTTCTREHPGCASNRGVLYDGDSDQVANNSYVVKQ